VSPLFESWECLRRPIWLFDPHALRGVYANTSALELWGAVSLEELLSRDFATLSPAVKARTDRLVELTADGAKADERWTFYPNGQPQTVQATISTLVLADGRSVLLFEASPVEVGEEERRAVEALRHAAGPISLIDAEGSVIFANPAAYSTYGRHNDHVTARFIEREPGQALFERALAGEIASGVLCVRTRDGDRWHQVDARRVTDPVTGAMGILINEQDVTARVEAEAARAAAEQRAAMWEARQRFLADMSHELRTPLTAVIGFSDLLKRTELPGEAAGQVARIHDAGERLLAVVNEMIADGDGRAAEPALTVAAAEPVQEAWDEALSEAGPRILYVDDNENNRFLVRAMLATQGVDCVTANDGSEGLAAATAADWDLILMDIQMPVMDGVAATRRIRALDGRHGQVPIVALTANTLDEQLQAYADAGMDDCLAKPVDMIGLISAVGRWAGQSRGGIGEGSAFADETGGRGHCAA